MVLLRLREGGEEGEGRGGRRGRGGGGEGRGVLQDHLVLSTELLM